LFPKTFDLAAAVAALSDLPHELRVNAPSSFLLVNSGCMAYRLQRWQPSIYFSQLDVVFQSAAGWQYGRQTEDWVFSRRVAEAGGKVLATTRVRTAHYGAGCFHSSDVWGQQRDGSQ